MLLSRGRRRRHHQGERRRRGASVRPRAGVEPRESRRLHIEPPEPPREQRPLEAAAARSQRARGSCAVLHGSCEHLEVGHVESWRVEEWQVADATHVEPHRDRNVLRSLLAVRGPREREGSDRSVEARWRAARQRPYLHGQRLRADRELAARIPSARPGKRVRVGARRREHNARGGCTHGRAPLVERHQARPGLGDEHAPTALLRVIRLGVGEALRPEAGRGGWRVLRVLRERGALHEPDAQEHRLSHVRVARRDVSHQRHRACPATHARGGGAHRERDCAALVDLAADPYANRAQRVAAGSVGSKLVAEYGASVGPREVLRAVAPQHLDAGGHVERGLARRAGSALDDDLERRALPHRERIAADARLDHGGPHR